MHKPKFSSVCVVLALIAFLGASLAPFRDDGRKHCRVRFGTSDAHELILARTSDSILLFRTADLDAVPEQYPFIDGELPFDVTIPSIKLNSGNSYTITSISEYTDDEPTYRHSLMIDVKIEGDTSFTQYSDVELTDGTNDLKVAHFDGPLSIGPSTINREIPPGTQFVIGGDPTDIRANVGTLDKTNGCWTVVESGDDNFLDGVHPTVTVEFPVEQSATPVKATYPLDEYC